MHKWFMIVLYKCTKPPEHWCWMQNDCGYGIYFCHPSNAFWFRFSRELYRDGFTHSWLNSWWNYQKSGALYAFVKFLELRLILSCERKVKGITLLYDSCFIPDSDMVTRTKTSVCEAAALKTENDLVLSGIIERADREGSRRERVQNLARKYHILLFICSLCYRYCKGQRISLEPEVWYRFWERC